MINTSELINKINLGMVRLGWLPIPDAQIEVLIMQIREVLRHDYCVDSNTGNIQLRRYPV